MRHYIGRVQSHIVKPHYAWPEERRWDYLNAIVLHLEYSREFNQILEQSMHQLWWTLPLPLEPKECSETIPLAKRVTSDTSSWRMRLTSHPLPTGISNVAELIFEAFNQPPRTLVYKHLAVLCFSFQPPQNLLVYTETFHCFHVCVCCFFPIVSQEMMKLTCCAGGRDFVHVCVRKTQRQRVNQNLWQSSSMCMHCAL